MRVTVPITAKHYFTAYDELWFLREAYVSASRFRSWNRAYSCHRPPLRTKLGIRGRLHESVDPPRNGRITEVNHTLMFLSSAARCSARCNAVEQVVTTLRVFSTGLQSGCLRHEERPSSAPRDAVIERSTPRAACKPTVIPFPQVALDQYVHLRIQRPARKT
jgi:hypothetical protein